MIWPIRWTVYLAFLSQIVFLILKLTGVIGWSWWIVCIPGMILVIIIAFLAWVLSALA